MHGGKAPQVAARREVRILEGEARLRGEQHDVRPPGEALLAAAHDADTMLQRLKREMAAGTLTPAALLSFGEWLDRTARITKTVLDAGVDERRVRLVEQQGRLLADGLGWFLRALDLDRDESARRLLSFLLRELDAGRVPQGAPPLQLQAPRP
jgi:hypothetical protein